MCESCPQAEYLYPNEGLMNSPRSTPRIYSRITKRGEIYSCSSVHAEVPSGSLHETSRPYLLDIQMKH